MRQAPFVVSLADRYGDPACHRRSKDTPRVGCQCLGAKPKNYTRVVHQLAMHISNFFRAIVIQKALAEAILPLFSIDQVSTR